MTYCCSDFHGYLRAYEAVNEYIKPNDKVIFLGDAADRGPDGWEIIKKILNNPQWIYLKGNHEDMLVKALKYYFIQDELEDTYSFSNALYHLESNGGSKTYEDAIMDANVRSIYEKIKNLPCYMEHESKDKTILLSHAGFTYKENLTISEKDLLWDRDHIDDITYYNDRHLVVHGHTPIPFIKLGYAPKEWDAETHWYNNGQKVCIDSGAVFYHKVILLNLDTLKDVILI